MLSDELKMPKKLLILLKILLKIVKKWQYSEVHLLIQCLEAIECILNEAIVALLYIKGPL